MNNSFSKMNGDENNSKEAEDVVKIKTMLNQAGITNYEPNVIHQLLYYAYNHVTNVLENARSLSAHARKKEVDNSDVNLAFKLMREKESLPVSQNLNTELATIQNSKPLPNIKPLCGIRLPSDDYGLLNTNYRLKFKPKLPVHVSMSIPVSLPMMVPKSQMTPIGTENNTTVIKRSRVPNMNEQRIIFRPKMKLNIKSEDDQSLKKKRLN